MKAVRVDEFGGPEVLRLEEVPDPKPVSGEGLIWKDQDYLLATFPAQTGGDALYVADTRNGMMGVFVWDSASKTLEAQAIRPLGEICSGSGSWTRHITPRKRSSSVRKA